MYFTLLPITYFACLRKNAANFPYANTLLHLNHITRAFMCESVAHKYMFAKRIYHQSEQQFTEQQKKASLIFCTTIRYAFHIINIPQKIKANSVQEICFNFSNKLLKNNARTEWTKNNMKTVCGAQKVFLYPSVGASLRAHNVRQGVKGCSDI